MNKRGYAALYLLLGFVLLTAFGITTDQILQNVYDSSNTALRVNLVSGGSSGTVTSSGASPNLAVFTTSTNIGSYAGTGACGAGTGITALSAAGVATCTAFGSGTITGSGTTGLIPDFTSSTAIGDSLAYRISVPNAASTGTTVNKLAKLTSAGAAVITGAAETSGILGIIHGGAGTTGSAVVTVIGTDSCVFDNATTSGNYVGVSSSVAGDCTDLGSSTFPAAGTVVIGTVTQTAAAGTRTMFFGTPDVASASSGGGGGGNKNPAGAAGNLQTKGSGNQFAVFAATDDTVPVGNGTIHVATAVTNCTDTGGNHLNYTAATNAFSCGTSSSSSLAFPLTVSGTTTSGGIPYFSSTTALTSSALLAANTLMIGGGAGTAPSTAPGWVYRATQQGGTITFTNSSDNYGLQVTGTFNSAGGGYAGIFADGTTAGSGAGASFSGIFGIIRAGYTGAGSTAGGVFESLVANTSVDLGFGAVGQPASDAALVAIDTRSGTGAGTKVAGYFTAQGSTTGNYGIIANMSSTVAGPNIGASMQSTGSTEATDFKDVGFQVSLVSGTAPFITGVNASVGGIIDSNGNDEMRFYNNKTLQATIASDGSFSTVGTITSSKTTNIGWTPVAGANTACNTTCTSACVFGTDSVTGGILACTDASADVCLCAGSS